MAVEGLPTSSVRNFQAEQPKQAQPITLPRGFFIFIFFYFRFLQKYISDLEIYRNIPRPLRCRAAGTWPPGSWAVGAYLQKKVDQNCAEVPGGPAARQQRGGQPSRPPGRGAAGPGRPPAGRPAPPTLYKVLAAPHPLFGLLKIQKKRKEREGVRERQSGETLSDFQAGDFR